MNFVQSFVDRFCTPRDKTTLREVAGLIAFGRQTLSLIGSEPKWGNPIQKLIELLGEETDPVRCGEAFLVGAFEAAVEEVLADTFQNQALKKNWTLAKSGRPNPPFSRLFCV